MLWINHDTLRPTFSWRLVTNPPVTHLGPSSVKCHAAVHSLLNKPEASESGKIRLHSVYVCWSVYTLSCDSCSAVCVHPVAFCRTMLSLSIHPHIQYARTTHTSEAMSSVYSRVSEHVNGNVGSSSCKQTSVRTREDRKWRLQT